MFCNCKSLRISASETPFCDDFLVCALPLWFGTSRFYGFLHWYKLFSAIHIDTLWYQCEILPYRNPQRQIPIRGIEEFLKSMGFSRILHSLLMLNMPLFSTFTSQDHAPSLGLTYKPIGQSWPNFMARLRLN